jgi:predicted RNase H-like nuclease (RuvC/YqgF family)
MDINKLVEQYTTIEEMKIFVAAQYKQVQNLAKENKELKEKLAKVEKASKEIVKSNASLPALNLGIQDDAKTIAQIQLNLLKEMSFERELTTDEAKRVELFNRILVEEADKKKTIKQADVEIIPASELLKLVE